MALTLMEKLARNPRFTEAKKTGRAYVIPGPAAAVVVLATPAQQIVTRDAATVTLTGPRHFATTDLMVMFRDGPHRRPHSVAVSGPSPLAAFTSSRPPGVGRVDSFGQAIAGALARLPGQHLAAG